VKKAVFLDRDGVINKVVYRDGNVSSPRNASEWKYEVDIEPFIEELKNRGYYIFVVTNQPDISRGYLDIHWHNFFLDDIAKKLSIDEICVCPHDDIDNCGCRKPKAGMLIDMASKWNIDLERSYILGDSIKDIDAGENAGCRTILLNRSYNQGVKSDFKIENILDALLIIL
jgi:D-glycero-D-manno-heptose 1,7-bisphosphate phosphatase